MEERLLDAEVTSDIISHTLSMWQSPAKELAHEYAEHRKVRTCARPGRARRAGPDRRSGSRLLRPLWLRKDDGGRFGARDRVFQSLYLSLLRIEAGDWRSHRRRVP